MKLYVKLLAICTVLILTDYVQTLMVGTSGELNPLAIILWGRLGLAAFALLAAERVVMVGTVCIASLLLGGRLRWLCVLALGSMAILALAVVAWNTSVILRYMGYEMITQAESWCWYRSSIARL